MTFLQDSCSTHSVEISIPSQAVSLHKECGKSAGKTKVVTVKGKDLSYGLIQVHVKMVALDLGMFTLSWEY